MPDSHFLCLKSGCFLDFIAEEPLPLPRKSLGYKGTSTGASSSRSGTWILVGDCADVLVCLRSGLGPPLRRKSLNLGFWVARPQRPWLGNSLPLKRGRKCTGNVVWLLFLGLGKSIYLLLTWPTDWVAGARVCLPMSGRSPEVLYTSILHRLLTSVSDHPSHWWERPKQAGWAFRV